MVNYTTNEQSLLNYLRGELSTTKSQLINQVEIHNYWSSGDYKKDMSGTQMTNEQIDFFITNSQNRIKPLRFRLEWLESQIDSITLKDLDISK